MAPLEVSQPLFCGPGSGAPAVRFGCRMWLDWASGFVLPAELSWREDHGGGLGPVSPGDSAPTRALSSWLQGPGFLGNLPENFWEVALQEVGPDGSELGDKHRDGARPCWTEK